MAAEPPAADHAVVISEKEMRDRRLEDERFRVTALLLHTRGFVVLKQAVPPETEVQDGRNPDAA